MPTVVTLTVKPSGGDYTSVSTAVAAIPSDIVATDEQYDIICDTFSGGLSDGFDFPSITSDATRFVRIAAASGHEYKRSDDSGFFMTATRNFDGVITNTSTNFLRVENSGFKNTGTSSARGITNSTDDVIYSGVYATTAAAFPAFNFSAGERVLLEFCMGEGGNRGFAFGSFSGGDLANCLAIDNSSGGYFKTGTSRQMIVKNCLELGSQFIDGTNNFNAASDYNAGSDTTAPGANSLDNRTTADLADYAGGDYRTASASALATAGEGGTFIGFELESAAGISVTESTTNTNYASLDPVITLTGSISINESLVNTNYTSLNPNITLTGSISVTENLTNVNYTSLNPSIALTGSISITEQVTNTNYTSLNPAITLTGVVQVTENTTNTSYNSLNPVITLTSTAIQIEEQTVNVQYNTLNPSILLTPEPLGIVSTVCFDGNIKSLSFNGVNIELTYNGNQKELAFNGDFNELEFNGTIQVNCSNGSIKTNC